MSEQLTIRLKLEEVRRLVDSPHDGGYCIRENGEVIATERDSLLRQLLATMQREERLTAELEGINGADAVNRLFVADLEAENIRLRAALAYALWQHDGGGDLLHGHWSAKARAALAGDPNE